MLHKDTSSKLSSSKCTVVYKTIHLHAEMRKKFYIFIFKVCVFCFKTPKNSSSSSGRCRAADSSPSENTGCAAQTSRRTFVSPKRNFAANESEFHPAVWSGLRSERWAEICQEDIKNDSKGMLMLPGVSRMSIQATAP